MKKSIAFILLAFPFLSMVSQASLVGVRDIDGNISLIINGVAYTNTSQDTAVRIGIWDAGTATFNMITASGGDNVGYFSADLIELKSSVDYGSNASIGYTSTAKFALGFYNLASNTANSTLASSTPLAVLTDTSWELGTFALATTQTWYTLNSSTSAVVGSYNYNAGNEVITLVPEPATGSLLLLGGLGLVALRRLRKV